MRTSLPDLNALAIEVAEADNAAQDDPDRREPYVAALLEFSAALLDQHEFADAMNASDDAMRVATSLIEDGEDQLRPRLAVAMRDHADALIELDEADRALELYGRAIRLFAELAEADVGVQPEFTRTLVHHGVALRRCGRVEDGLELLDQARRLYTGFALGADGDRDQVLGLARTQLHRGKALAELGCANEAIAASREAVTMLRALADSHGDADTNTDTDEAARIGLALADSLDALATLLRALDRVDEAIEPATEGLELVTRLAQDDGVRYLHPLARMTNNLARCYQQVERFEDAARLFEQAVTAFQILAEAQAHAHRATLIQVMSNHALALAQIEDFARAYEIAEQTLVLAGAESSWALLPLVTGLQQFMADLCEDLGQPEARLAHLVAGLQLLREASAEQLPGADAAATRFAEAVEAAATAAGIELSEAIEALVRGS